MTKKEEHPKFINVGDQRFELRDRFKNFHEEVVVGNIESQTYEARVALSLIERWGLVAGEVDGEDAAGRQKIRRLTPEELVAEACETAAAAIRTFRERGWLVAVPSNLELIEALGGTPLD